MNISPNEGSIDRLVRLVVARVLIGVGLGFDPDPGRLTGWALGAGLETCGLKRAHRRASSSGYSRVPSQ